MFGKGEYCQTHRKEALHHRRLLNLEPITLNPEPVVLKIYHIIRSLSIFHFNARSDSLLDSLGYIRKNSR